MSIKREGAHVWRVSGAAIERMVIQTDWDKDEAVAYLQHRFDRSGLDDRLEKAGCVPGDEVRILELAFTYEGEPSEDDYAELAEDEPDVRDDGGEE